MRCHPVIDWHYREIWAVSEPCPLGATRADVRLVGVLKERVEARLWTIIKQLLTCALQFIKHLEIPYCSLYDLGYTSLGGTTDTHPNPKLQVGTGIDQGVKAKFRPAYELTEDEEERLGRDWYKKA